MTINNKFGFGDTVYFKVDPERKPYMMTDIRINANGGLSYCCSGASEHQWGYEIEITIDMNDCILQL